MGDVGEIVLDGLNRLRKGRGVLAGDLDQRIRPEFGVLFGATTDTGSALLDKLLGYLDELLAGLPDQLQRAARCGLNLPPSLDGDNLQRRLAVLADEFYCDVRTARRRMDDAFTQMAANAARGDRTMSGAGHGGPGWYVDVFDAVLRLDLDSPQAVERSTIVVTAQTLDRVSTSTDIPRHPESLGTDVGLRREIMFGGLLADTGQGSSTNFSAAITLPRTLRQGERHTYCLINSIPAGQPMAPRYVYVPYRQCRYFTLLVRFHPDRLPSQVWKHDGVPHSAVDDGAPSGEALTLDRAHEIRLEFRDLINGCAYGVQWR